MVWGTDELIWLPYREIKREEHTIIVRERKKGRPAKEAWRAGGGRPTEKVPQRKVV